MAASTPASRRREQEERREIPRRIPSKAGGPIEIEPPPSYGAKGSSVHRLQLRENPSRKRHASKRNGPRVGKRGTGAPARAGEKAARLARGEIARLEAVQRRREAKVAAIEAAGEEKGATLDKFELARRASRVADAMRKVSAARHREAVIG